MNQKTLSSKSPSASNFHVDHETGTLALYSARKIVLKIVRWRFGDLFPSDLHPDQTASSSIVQYAGNSGQEWSIEQLDAVAEGLTLSRKNQHALTNSALR